MLSARNGRLLSRLAPFVVATRETLRWLNLSPFGVPIDAAQRWDPLHTATAPFLERLHALDQASFGPGGMPMPRWILLDGSALPGLVFGMAAPARTLGADTLSLLRVPQNHGGPVALAMYIAIPSHEPGTWVGHNLSSVAHQLPAEGLRGLGSLTKALALAVTRAETQIGISQWDSVALRVHTRLGPLELLSAWTPAHSKACTFTYRCKLSERALRHLAREAGPPPPAPPCEEWLQGADGAHMQRLQQRLEAGERWCICGPPEGTLDGEHRVPLARWPRP